MKKNNKTILSRPLNNLRNNNVSFNSASEELISKESLSSLLSLKKFKESYSLVLPNIYTKSNDSDLWFLMGFSCRVSGDIQSASICLKNGLALDSDDRKLVVMYCMNCIDQSLYKEALICLDNFSNDKIFPDILNAYALVHRGLGNERLAGQYFQKVLRLNKPVENIFYNYAVFLSSIKKYRLSLKYYKKVLKIFPKNINALFNIGTSFIAIKDFEKAKSSFLEVISLDSKHIKAHLNLATLYSVESDHEKAKKIYKTILDLSPKNIDAITNLANISYNLKYYNEAKKLAKKGLELDDKNINALNTYAAILFGVEEYEDSIGCSKKVLTIEPSNLTALMNLINAYYHTRAWSSVKGTFDIIRGIDPCNPLMASLEPLLCYDQGVENKSKFLKDPLSYVKEFHIKDYTKELDIFLNDFLNFAKTIPSREDPAGKTTINGLQTLPIVFEQNKKIVKDLRNIIEKSIKDYQKYFEGSNDYFVSRWPSESSLKGWIVYLRSQGLQTSHNHLSGWMSGVLYLNIPKMKDSGNEGAIKFNLHGYEYPKNKNNIPEKIIMPVTGSIVLFPSSLYHSTIPFNSNENRISLAFDLMPGNQEKRVGMGI